MLGLGAATRVHVATGVTDMRLEFDDLYALAAGKLQQNPQSGHLFLFSNMRHDGMKFFSNTMAASFIRTDMSPMKKMLARTN